MEHDNSVVRGEPDVAFDSGARFERGSEGDQAVLWKARAIVQAAVGEPLRTWVERIRP